MWYYVALGLILLAALIHYAVKKPYSFFKKRGIYFVTLFNPYQEMFQILTASTSLIDNFVCWYRADPNKKYYGSFPLRSPALMIRDPELIRQVTTKDFDHFTDHVDLLFREDVDPLFGKNLFALKGQRWHQMRGTLSPSFTGSKMRGMFTLMADCGDQLVAYLNKQYENDKRSKLYEVNFKDITTRFTNDIIATTAFGIKIDSFENQDNDFYRIGRQIQKFSTWKFVVIAAAPWLAKLLGIRLLPDYISKFFTNLIRETLETREKEHIVRPDMINLLMEARQELADKGSPADNNFTLNLDDITAQSFVFFAAGFETVSAAMCFSIYEITLNSDIQKKLQSEIDETLASCNGKVTYDALMKMKYLDMVVSEALRKWPPAVATDRVCVKTYELEVDGEVVVIEPGMNLHLPAMGIHRDEKYFPNPELFDPERFSPENKDLIQPGVYMPFGAGPRICIANRFALMETKVILFRLFANFDFEVIGRTPIPMVLKKGGGNMDAEDGFWFGIKPRQTVK